MGGQESKPDPKSPLGCLLKNLPAIDPGLKRKWLILLPTTAWPLYQLDNHETWTPEGTFNFVALTDLDNFCRWTGKWSEVPYIQGFWVLRSCPDLCAQCCTAQVLLARGNSDPYGLLSQLPQNPLPPFLIPLKILLLLLLLISSHPWLFQPWPSLLSRILPLPLKTFPPQSAHTPALALI